MTVFELIATLLLKRLRFLVIIALAAIVGIAAVNGLSWTTFVFSFIAIGLLLFAGLAIRAAHTFLLTRRVADLVVVFGLALLGSALYAALVLTFMDLGWWIGHLFELLGITLVGASAAYDLRRGRRSRPLAGDFRASP